jgi:hypothetical protein
MANFLSKIASVLSPRSSLHRVLDCAESVCSMLLVLLLLQVLFATSSSHAMADLHGDTATFCDSVPSDAAEDSQAEIG